MQHMHIGEIRRITLPWSEACIHLRVADREMTVECLANGAQLRNDDGSAFSFPITHGEAGIKVVPACGDRVTIDGDDAIVTGVTGPDEVGRCVFIVETADGRVYQDVKPDQIGPARQIPDWHPMSSVHVPEWTYGR